MDYVGIPKMSLVAQYDDMCRYTKVLTEGCEEEFKIFVEGQLSNVQSWKKAEKEIETLQDKVKNLEAEKKRLDTQLKHIRNLCELEVLRRKKTEEEKNSMERQIALIKEVLLSDGSALDNQTKEKLVLLSSTCKPHANLETIEESVGSLLSLSDYDQSEENLENDSEAISYYTRRRSKGKRSSLENQSSPKRRKSAGKDQPKEEAFSDVAPRGKSIRISSEPASNTPEVILPSYPTHKSDSGKFTSQPGNLRRSNTGSFTSGTPTGRYSTGSKLSRMHMFCTKTVIRTEKCYPCGRLIKFCKQALKCQDCRITCHPECKDQCPLPCIPTTNTPIKGTMGTISEYVSSSPPMIPALIVHLINEIELRGLKEVGLYRISGSEREVRELKEKFFKGRSIPSLNQVDIHAVCGAVKEFFRSLKDPLLTRSAWQAFVDAADVSSAALSLNALYEAVCELPQPNRDTLAFLVLHLQRVAESSECKMPIENLAKVFGPTIVGYSTEDPSDSKLWNETAVQSKVMQRLLSIPADYWQNLLNSIEPDVFETIPKTPDSFSVLTHSRLGPIYSSGEKKKSTQLGRSPLTPRTPKLATHKGKRQFFSSPLLK